MQLDRTTIELIVGPAGLAGLLAALARWWRKSKPTIRIGPGRFEVKWRA